MCIHAHILSNTHMHEKIYLTMSLTINVMRFICMYMFIQTYMHRRSVRSVDMGLVRAAVALQSADPFLKTVILM